MKSYNKDSIISISINLLLLILVQFFYNDILNIWVDFFFIDLRLIYCFTILLKVISLLAYLLILF
jgi:hypothetical protein